MLWALVSLFPIYETYTVLANEKGYRKATFVVEQLYFRKSRTTGRGHALEDSWSATGRIEDAQERFSLGGYLPRHPRSQEDLESMVKPGTEFKVLYNP